MLVNRLRGVSARPMPKAASPEVRRRLGCCDALPPGERAVGGAPALPEAHQAPGEAEADFRAAAHPPPLASADIVLMTSDLRRLGTCLRLSRRCRRTIHTNVAIGLGWTIILVSLAAAGMLGAEGAIVAAVVHNLSTFIGMANAGRLLRFDEPLGPDVP